VLARSRCCVSRGMQAVVTPWLICTLQLHMTLIERRTLSCGGHAFAWVSCIYSRTVDAETSASCNCTCLLGILKLLCFVENHRTFSRTPRIHIWSAIIRQNTNILFGLLFHLNGIFNTAIVNLALTVILWTKLGRTYSNWTT